MDFDAQFLGDLLDAFFVIASYLSQRRVEATLRVHCVDELAVNKQPNGAAHIWVFAQCAQDFVAHNLTMVSASTVIMQIPPSTTGQTI